jgi:MFS family permease
VPAEPGRQHPNVTLAVLVAAGISYALMQSLVLPALPDISRSLGASDTAIAWMLTAYLLAASVCTPIAGRLGDMYGKQRVLIVVLVLLAVGTLVSALASSIGPMIAGRVIQGAGGGIFPLGFGIIRDEFPRERVSHGIGLMSSLLGVGGGLGVILAGPIVDNLSYHWLFWLPLVVIVACAVATQLLVPESPVRTPGRVDVRGALVLAAGLVPPLYAISRANDWGWGDPRTLGLIAIGVAVLAVTGQLSELRIRSTASARRSSGTVSEMRKKPSPLGP